MAKSDTHDYPLLLTFAQMNALLNSDEDTTTKQGNARLVRKATSVAKKNRTRMVLEDLKAGRL